jgi:4-hydroxy-tetrahydrodipicolinate synthase
MLSLPPKGLIGVLITPLDDQGNIDAQSLESLVNSTLNYVDGLLAGVSFTGEGFFLGNEKKLELIRISLEIVRGRVPLILGITGNSPRETAENISALEKIRNDSHYPGDIFLFDCPLWYHSNRGLFPHYQELGKLTELSFILCNNPYLISRLKGHLRRKNIRTNVLKKLSGNERIVGLKHSGEAKRTLNYLKAVRERKDFIFYDGDELNFLNGPGPGGVVSAGVNILPRDWKEIVASSLNPHDSRKEDPDYCRHLWETGEKLKFFRSSYRSNPAAIIKTALKYRGIIKSNRVVEGTAPVTREEEKKIRSLLTEYGLI